MFLLLYLLKELIGIVAFNQLIEFIVMINSILSIFNNFMAHLKAII